MVYRLPGTTVRKSYARGAPPLVRCDDYRAGFTEGAIESNWTTGYGGRPTGTLTEYTEQGKGNINLSAGDAYMAVIDHVIACGQGRDTSRITPASVLDTLQLTLDIHAAIAVPKRP